MSTRFDQASEDERTDAWLAARIELLEAALADRALAPAARHALVELLFDGFDDALHREPDLHLGWSARLSARLRLTTRGTRKALAELAELGLVEASRGDVRVLPGAAAERLCRGTNLPQQDAAAQADPIRAHADRLGGLRDHAIDAGLVATAVAAERALGRALGFYARKAGRFDYVPPDYAAMPPHERKGMLFNMVIPMLRDYFLLDPERQDELLAFFAEFRRASGVGPPSAVQANSNVMAGLDRTSPAMTNGWAGE